MLNLVRRSSHAVLVLALLAGCTSRSPVTEFSRTPTSALAQNQTQDTILGRAIASGVRAHPGESGFHLLTTGTGAFLARIALVQSAQKSIDMQYFTTRDDTTGKLLLEEISRAAARGVRVRMLLDDWNLDDFRKGAVALDASPNIEIRVFNPYTTSDQSVFAWVGNVFTRTNEFTRRMHNKALIADNQLAIMGGRNLGDEYFGASAEVNFRDVDVLAAGPIAGSISKNFDRYWNSAESYPLAALKMPQLDAEDIEKLRAEIHQHWQDELHSKNGSRLDTHLPEGLKTGRVALIWGKGELAADSPTKVDQPTDTSASNPGFHIEQLASGAQHEFIIITPYFVPLDDGVEWLKALVGRGVHVRIVTNSLASTDVVPAQSGYSHYRQALVEDGVELYEIKAEGKPDVRSMFKGSSQNGLHAKIYMIDRRDLVIGSFNMDQRSVRLNTEQVLVIHSPELCKQVADLFDQLTAPAASYRVILAAQEPAAQDSAITTGALVWETQENGKEEYYDLNPHAGFWRRITDKVFSALPMDDEL